MNHAMSGKGKAATIVSRPSWPGVRPGHPEMCAALREVRTVLPPPNAPLGPRVNPRIKSGDADDGTERLATTERKHE